MESQPYLDFLKRGAKVWNEWREQNPSTRPDANPLGQYVTALAEDGDYGKHVGYMTEIREDLEKLEEQLRENNGRILVVIGETGRKRSRRGD